MNTILTTFAAQCWQTFFVASRPAARMFHLVLPIVLLAGNSDAAPISFNRDIRPILSDRCFHCHGPDKKKREGDLRLDQPDGKEGALQARDGRTPIKPGDLKASTLWHHITTDDEDERMPPADSGKKPLSAEEQQRFKDWILQGAKYEQFWSLGKERGVASGRDRSLCNGST